MNSPTVNAMRIYGTNTENILLLFGAGPSFIYFLLIGVVGLPTMQRYNKRGLCQRQRPLVGVYSANLMRRIEVWYSRKSAR